MVRISAPSAWTAKTVQDLTERPSRSTVQAPQEMNQKGPRLDQRFHRLAVHLHRDLGLGHMLSPLRTRGL
jgi:hypothetical protein